MGRIYYGWYVVAITIIVYMVTVGSTHAAFGLFVVPVSAEFGLSRADMNTGFIIFTVGSALFSPLFGRALDRYPLKRIVAVCAILFGFSFIALGLSPSLWLSAAILAVPLAIGMLGMGTITLFVLVARWFTVQRGRAMALSAVGLSLGHITVTPLVGLLIQNLGWRAALMISGAIITPLILIVIMVLRERPGPGDVEGGETAAEAAVRANAPAARPATMGELLRKPLFWSMALGVALALSVAQTMMITLVPLALGKGLTMVESASLMSVAGVGSIAGKLMLAAVADRVNRVNLLIGLFGLGVVLNVGLLFSHSYAPLIGCAAIMGLMGGAMAPAFFALLADRFGTESFGTAQGLVVPFIAIGAVVAIRFAGEVFDRTGNYDALFITFIFVEIAAIAMLMLSTRFGNVRPAERRAVPIT